MNQVIEWAKTHPYKAASIATGIAGALGYTVPAWVWPLAKAILGAL